MPLSDILTPNSKPSAKLQDRAKDFLGERVKASRKTVNSKKGDWDRWQKMWDNEQMYTDVKQNEVNLVLPKIDYIVETMSAKIVNTIFGVADWLTMKQPGKGPHILRDELKLMMHVMKRAKYYICCLEMSKGAPIKGTALCKIGMRDFWPCTDFLKLEDFLPDPYWGKPGDIQGMRYAAQLLTRDLNTLKNTMKPPMIQGGNPLPLYFNLDILEEQATLQNQPKDADKKPPEHDKYSKIFRLVEYHGEFEYKEGQWAECVLTGEIDEDNEEKIKNVIRTEDSKLFYFDNFIPDKKVYLKPFVSSIYSVDPGKFYGKSGVKTVESLVNELTEHHNVYLENHKRLVHGITKVLNRAELTRKDLPFKSGALWYLDNMDDVDVVQHNEANIAAYKVIDDIINREIEKSSGITLPNLGVSSSKRQTYGEIRSLLSEANDRQTVFLQMTDMLTLRPIAFQIYKLMQTSFDIFHGKELTFEGNTVTVNRESLADDIDVSFAATTIENEYSKYAKQEFFPQVLDLILKITEKSGRILNPDEIIQEVGELFNIKKPERFLEPAVPMIQVPDLPPEWQPYAMQILQQKEQQMAIAEQYGGKLPDPNKPLPEQGQQSSTPQQTPQQ